MTEGLINNTHNMDKKQLTPQQEQAKKALLTGHFPYMLQAVAVAYQLIPAWRHASNGVPCSILDLFQAAKKYDETHPRKEDDNSFFYVTLEGAIGYCPTGVEFQVTWLFYPMEPGKERDAVLAKVQKEIRRIEDREEEVSVLAPILGFPKIAGNRKIYETEDFFRRVVKLHQHAASVAKLLLRTELVAALVVAPHQGELHVVAVLRLEKPLLDGLLLLPREHPSCTPRRHVELGSCRPGISRERLGACYCAYPAHHSLAGRCGACPGALS